VTREGRLLFAGRALRTFCFGWLSLTTSARSLAQAMAPVLTGLAMARAATGIPFFVAGGLKIVYDLALYFRFRRLPLSADETTAR
jgi:hypothetical protein